MKLTKEALVRIIKQEIASVKEADIPLEKVVHPTILKAAEEAAEEILDNPGLQKLIDQEAESISDDENTQNIVKQMIKDRIGTLGTE